MKYCVKCGKELIDEAVVCTGCGCAAAPAYNEKKETTYDKAAEKAKRKETFELLIKIFMIVGTVIMGMYLIPLAWCLPMLFSYMDKVKNKQPISTEFKICTLIFVSVVAGVLMLCDTDE